MYCKNDFDEVFYVWMVYLVRLRRILPQSYRSLQSHRFYGIPRETVDKIDRWPYRILGYKSGKFSCSFRYSVLGLLQESTCWKAIIIFVDIYLSEGRTEQMPMWTLDNVRILRGRNRIRQNGINQFRCHRHNRKERTWKVERGRIPWSDTDRAGFLMIEFLKDQGGWIRWVMTDDLVPEWKASRTLHWFTLLPYRACGEYM